MWLGHVWRYGHEAEKILQSRVHRLPHLQQAGHVSHHAPLSTALLQIRWVLSAKLIAVQKIHFHSCQQASSFIRKTMQVDQHFLLINNMDSGPAQLEPAYWSKLVFSAGMAWELYWICSILENILYISCFAFYILKSVVCSYIART